MSTQSQYLFVYGTLCQSAPFSNSAFLQVDAEYLGPASTLGRLFLVEHYPALIENRARNDTDSKQRVQGELYRVKNATTLFSRLDHYERCSADFLEPTEYKRVVKEVSYKGETFLSWIYLYNLPTTNMLEIKNGNFSDFLRVNNRE